MHIKQRHLEVFDAVIAAGSISRAAAQLNLSQPAVSIALANLEESIGFKLFQRDRGFFAPTREAFLLQDEMAQGLLALSRVSQRISEIRAWLDRQHPDRHQWRHGCAFFAAINRRLSA
jgi:DNA-binding transcriptional LysR family regulator